jgi:hypothetical protein
MQSRAVHPLSEFHFFTIFTLQNQNIDKVKGYLTALID